MADPVTGRPSSPDSSDLARRLDSFERRIGMIERSTTFYGASLRGNLLGYAPNGTRTILFQQDDPTTTADETEVFFGTSDGKTMLHLYSNSFNHSVYLGDFEDNQAIVIQNPDTYIQAHTTTSSAANCFISNSGQIQQVVSSLRYKQDVAPAIIDIKSVLSLMPRSFRRRDEVSNGRSTLRDLDSPPVSGFIPPTYVGFIAEEADAAGLKDWVAYDELGRPDSFQYPAFVVAHQAVLQAHQKQIELLQAQVVALNQRVNALTPTQPPLT